ncbi:MAG: ATP-binding cassette domain-containing protein [Proteobacteria bacterium]|nr:ATP-binding cassette domain-containing protein [Pseudomonadota bacterium]
MAEAKTLFQDLKTRLEPKAYRWRQGNAEPAAATASEADALDAARTGTTPAKDEPAPLAREVEAALNELESMATAPGGGQMPRHAFETMTDSIHKLVTEIEMRTGDRPRPEEPPQPIAAEQSPSDNAETPAPAAEAVSDPTVADTPAEDGPNVPLKGNNLLADVRALAASWFRNGRASDAAHRGPGDIATPEELKAAAADRGVDVSYAEKSLNRLTEKDFPCIALDRTGGSHVLVGRPDKHTLLARVGGSIRSVSLSSLQAIASGVVFFVRPRATPAPEPAIGTTSEQPPPDKRRLAGIFGIITREMLATQRPLLWQLALATVLSNLFTFALPLFSMAVYDRVVPHMAWETLWALSIGVVIILGADFALRYIRMKLLDSVGLTTSTTLQAQLYSRIVHGRMQDIPSVSGGISAGMREVEALCHVVPSLLIGIAVDLPFFLLAAVLIYSIGGLVALAPIIGAVALAGLHLITHLGEDAARKHSRYVGTQTNALLETLGTLETVKTTGSERMLLRRWERLVDASSFASHLNRLQGNFSGQASIVIGQAVTVLAMIIAVYEISTGSMTIGAMSASVLLIGRMMTPISQLMTYLHRAHQLSTSAQMIQRMFTLPQENAGDASEVREETPLAGHLQMHNVRFSYPGEQAPNLENITLEIRPGEKIGLIGRVGSGKSTLLRLILRLHDPSEGTILLDSKDMRQVSPRALRRIIGFMRQDSVLFDDTLQANICFGLEKMKQANFERAVTITGVKDFAARNPAGYGLRVGSRGERLSGGERQAVAMARILVEDSPVFVLDEPTAAMDNALEASIVRELRDVVANKTLIVATHRAPLLSLVDRIIWMDNGRIVADGPKAEVLQRLNQQAA